MSALLPSFQRRTDVILSESNRWNPHADVAELVDALVSGSTWTKFHQCKGQDPRPDFPFVDTVPLE